MLWCCGMDFVGPPAIIISVAADNSPYFGWTRAGGLILAIFFHIDITPRLRAAIVIEVGIIEIMGASTLVDLVVNLVSTAYFRGAICRSCRLWSLDKLCKFQNMVREHIKWKPHLFILCLKGLHCALRMAMQEGPT